jgi:hypothetical protein
MSHSRAAITGTVVVGRRAGLLRGEGVQGMAADHTGVGRGRAVVLDAASAATGAVVDVDGQNPLGHARLTDDERD